MCLSNETSSPLTISYQQLDLLPNENMDRFSSGQLNLQPGELTITRSIDQQYYTMARELLLWRVRAAACTIARVYYTMKRKGITYVID